MCSTLPIVCLAFLVTALGMPNRDSMQDVETDSAVDQLVELLLRRLDEDPSDIGRRIKPGKNVKLSEIEERIKPGKAILSDLENRIKPGKAILSDVDGHIKPGKSKLADIEGRVKPGRAILDDIERRKNPGKAMGLLSDIEKRIKPGKTIRNNGLSSMNEIEILKSADTVHSNKHMMKSRQNDVSACGGVLEATDEEQSIWSPGYPNGYENDISCVWTIRTKDPNKQVKLTFDDLQLEPCGVCNFDRVVVKTSPGGHPARFCMPYHKAPVTSEADEMEVEFTTDGSETYPGFKAFYKQVGNDDEKIILLNIHNQLRREAKASDMAELTWNDELARIATEWSKTCVDEHGQPATSYPGDPDNIGQNLAANTQFNLEGEVKRWHDEKVDYDYNTDTCTGVCGHYTQVVWAKSREVGCGYTLCPNMLETDQGQKLDAYYLVCNYGPGGNIPGQKPFQLGSPCGQCPSGTSCENGLCKYKV